jgi:TonB-linked SusC/RagA family outer membrane protein
MSHSRRLWCGATVIVAATLALARPAAAQDAVIQGRVIDDRGDALPVATVQIPQLNVGVLTTSQGRYTIVIPGPRVSGQTVTLRVRVIGHKPSARQVVVRPGEQTQDFTLASDVNQLDAVVVTGVQEATERVKVPFSVTTLDASKLPVAASNALTELQGKLPANIVSNSGRPGDQPSVLLRGPTSLNAQGRSQDPLYIVDGVIINGSLPEINPNDIEHIEVVKGAAGASMYGARAGNGVINITTKSGRRSNEGVTFGIRSEAGTSDIERDFGIAQRTALLMSADGKQFCTAVTGQPTCAQTFDYAYWQQQINNQPTDWAGNPPSLPVDPGATINPNTGGGVLRQRFQIDPWPGHIYNAVRQVVTNNPYLDNNLDLTGRYGATRFYASAENLKQQGAIRFLQGLTRTSFRANVDQAVGSQVNIAVRTFFSRSSQDGFNQDAGGNAFFVLTRQPGIANVLATDSLGRLYIRPNLQGGGAQNANPLYQLANIDRQDVTNRFIGGVTLQYAPSSWLDLSGNVSYDMRRTNSVQFRDKGYRSTGPNPAPGTNLGFIFRNGSPNESFNSDVTATVRHDFGHDLRTRYTLRYSYEQRDSSIAAGQGDFLSFKGIDALTNATLDQTITSYGQSVRQIGLFAGANVEYKERYILDGLVRRDGSSLFGAGHRWATFGRISGEWLMQLEPWWFTDKVTLFKLHASYGTAGNSPAFSSQYESFGIGAGGVPVLQFLGNRDLGPEIHHELELGADIELLGKFGLTATYARSRITDQILPAPVSVGTGFQNQWRNAGALLNISHELSLTLPFVQQRDVTWTMSLIYDHNRSFITRLDVPPYNYGANLQATDQIFLARAGEQIGTFYGRAFLTTCGQLPAPFSGDCGAGKAFQINDQGFLVWVGAGNNPGMGITNNLWQTQLPASQAPWGVAINWGMPIILRGAGADGHSARIVRLGNVLPDFRFGITQNITWKRFSVYGLLDAAIGQSVWDQGFHWAHLDFLSKDVDQTAASVQSAKPIGYYYRAPFPDGTGIGGLYDILGPNNFSVEKASFAKLRELLVSYRIGPIAGAGDWQVSVVGRNLLTITGYRGFDPEVGIPNVGTQGGTSQGGQLNSGALNAVDAFTFPNLRTFTIGVSSTF